MTGFLLRIVINAGALLLIAQFSAPAIRVDSFLTAIVAALSLGIANATVKPILQAIAGGMTCVLSCLTLGLWSLLLSWLISALLFWVAGQYLQGFHVQGFGAAMMGALALSIVNALAGAIIGRDKDKNER